LPPKQRGAPLSDEENGKPKRKVDDRNGSGLRLLPYMNQTDFIGLTAPDRFNPFVVTLSDGFSIAIGQFERDHLIAAPRVFVTMDNEGTLIHIPYRSIAHIEEPA
jgi:hypothetical protein